MQTPHPLPGLLMETERLVLRAPQPDDLTALQLLLAEPAQQRFERVDPRQANERLALWRADWASQGLGPWAVLLRDAPELGVLGFGGLRHQRLAGTPVLLLSFSFRSQFWGQGYAAEMALAALGLAFGRLGAGAVQALLPPGNAAARKTLERLGLHLKGSLAEVPGQAPSLIYEISAEQHARCPVRHAEPTPFGA